MSGHQPPAHGRLQRLTVVGPASGTPVPGVGRDPVCGMMVPLDAPLRATFEGRTTVFCSPACLTRFEKQPRGFLEEGGPPLAMPPAAAR